MTSQRTVEDRLRAEYFDLIPDMQRTLVALDSVVRQHLLSISVSLNRYEQVRVVSRLKECASAIDALRRRQQGRVFDPEKAETYSLSDLPDLVATRVLAFPSQRVVDAHEALRPILSMWNEDPILGVKPSDPPRAIKYFGHCDQAPTDITAEIQIVSSLIGSFWEVEHSALYKTSPDLQGVLGAESMTERSSAVHAALREFENEFERLIAEAAELEGSPPSGR
jgi:ppGpp synthetase/RelA/SpoT-type nucleotidyltranferase